mgnify:CR=1 FL=1
MSIVRHAGNLSRPTIVSAETMLRAVLDYGLVPFFENPIPGYSVEEMTHPSYWFDGDAGVLGPWDWKIGCVESGDILYGKFLCGGKAAFATPQWYRELRNYRQSLEKYALQPGPQTVVMDYIREKGSITVKEVRGLLDIKKSAADALLTRLQMQCRVVIGDLRRVYSGPDLHYSGWQVASFCRPEDLAGSGSFPGAPAVFPFANSGNGLECSHSPSESYKLLSSHITELSGETSSALIAKILG